MATIKCGFLLLIASLSFWIPGASAIDSDFDGIEDTRDSQPNINNVPKIDIEPENLEFGLSYFISGNENISSTKTYTLENSNRVTSSTSKKIEEGKKISETAATNIAANLSIGKGFLFGASATGRQDRSSEYNLSGLNQYSDESINNYKNEMSTFAKNSKDLQYKFEAQSGYVATGIRLINNNDNIVTLKDVKVKLVEHSPVNNTDIRSIDIIKLGDIEVPPSSVAFPYKSVPINVEKLATDKILLMQTKGHIFRIGIESYKIMYNGIEMLPQMLDRNLSEKCFRLNIIDEHGFHKKYDIPFMLSDASRATLRKVLPFVFNQWSVASCHTKDGKSFDYIDNVNGVRSDFCDSTKLLDEKIDDTKEGAWFVFADQTSDKTLGVDFHIDPGKEIAIVYMTKKMILDKVRVKSTSINRQYGKVHFPVNGYYFFHHDPPIYDNAEKNKSMHAAFIRMNGKSINPKKIIDNLFIASPGDRIELDFVMYRSPLRTEDVSFRIDNPYDKRSVKIKNIPIKYELFQSNNLDGYGVGLQFGGTEKIYRPSELKKYSNYFEAEIKPNGRARLVFEPDLKVMSAPDSPFNVIIEPNVTRLEYGVEVVDHMRGDRVIATFTTDNVQELRHGDVTVSIFKKPKISK